jgi:signal peptidase I
MQRPEIKLQDSQEIEVHVLVSLMREVLGKGALFRFKARGSSMHPFIQDGDLITVASLSIDKPAIGKVTAFLQPNSERLTVHRIIRKRDSHFQIKGDNIPTQSDGWIPLSEMIGSIVQVHRDGRRICFGLGLERIIIAWMSDKGLLIKITRRFSRLLLQK